MIVHHNILEIRYETQIAINCKGCLFGRLISTHYTQGKGVWEKRGRFLLICKMVEGSSSKDAGMKKQSSSAVRGASWRHCEVMELLSLGGGCPRSAGPACMSQKFWLL